ncbi:hypothetical protein CDAR_558101 [Caerostris darwini]|uniref:Uncharacterized protein n=1 Tax=Caerostris darwini TaxID=1538125 RepID=A0AAV4R5R7_9ARAC|nr:hypothetical protein CDAR_558101 [Caerostris darwini]
MKIPIHSCGFFLKKRSSESRLGGEEEEETGSPRERERYRNPVSWRRRNAQPEQAANRDDHLDARYLLLLHHPIQFPAAFLGGGGEEVHPYPVL